MKKLYNILLFIILLFGCQQGYGQMNTVPEFPTSNTEITITFDSSKESRLGMFTEDLYAHTGVMIEGDTEWQHVIGTWGDNSTQPQLTNKGNGIYELVITPNITEYYSVADGEVVTDIALVFRSADGSSQTNNLTIEVFKEGLNVSFAKPVNNSIFGKNETVLITANSAGSESLELFIDGVSMSTTSTTTLNYSYAPHAAGDHQLIAVATAGDKEAKDTVNFIFREDTQIETKPSGLEDGINYPSTGSGSEVILQLYAPKKEFVYLIGDFNNWMLSNSYQMKKDGDYFWLSINGLTAGKEYIFQYLIDGEIKIADPYADKVLDPWNDQYISTSTYPNLIAYPSSKTSEFASVLQTAQTAYTWSDTEFTMPDHDDLVIYELLIRDFTTAGNIKTVTDTLDYLQRLGINAIELMPFNEFEGNDSWGYNPAFYFAPDKAYGTKNDYKAFINECHKRGIAVIMDMVLNHSFGQSPFFRMYSQDGKPTADNPWYNQEHNFANTDAHWGADFNHESEDTQKLVDRINAYWMDEYHIDGYRFDFTKGFSNTYHDSSDEWASNYDADRVRLLKRMADKIWEANPNAFVSFEHLSENSEEKELAAHGIHLWGNANHDYSEATKGSSSNFSWTSWKNRGWDGPKVVSYMESHDEERMMYRNLTEGTSSDGYNVKSLNTALSRIETAAAFFLTIPGPKMIWQFGELGYDISINENGRVGRKPIHWEYQDNPNRQRVYQVFAALAKIKKEETAFESDDFTLNTTQALKRIEINHTDMDVRIIGNFDVKTGSISPKFSKTGTWYGYFSGTEINVTDVDANIQLAPGEYQIYTTKQLTTPNVISAPVASDVLIAGIAKENETLTASYSYSDANGDAEGTSIYRWYRADDVNGTNEMGITDATNLTYTPGADDRHKYIRFSVIPVAQTGELLQGDIVYSTYTDEIVSLVNPPVASNLAINGEFKQDAVLTASYTYSDADGDSEGNSIIQWYRADNNTGSNEIAIQGANKLNYTIIRQDVGKYLRIAVTPIAISGDLLTGKKIYSAYTQEIASAVGIEDVLDKELRIYPNPVKDLLHLDNLNEVKRVSLYNLTGKTVLYKNNPNSNEILSLRHFNQGIYIIVFDLKDGSRLTRKIVKQ